MDKGPASITCVLRGGRTGTWLAAEQPASPCAGLGTLSVSTICSNKDSFQPRAEGPAVLFLATAYPNFPGCFEVLSQITLYYCTWQRILVLILGVGYFALLGPEIKDFSLRFGVRACGFENRMAWLLAQSRPVTGVHAKLPCFSLSIPFFPSTNTY